MKRYDPQRADARSLPEKAIGLLFAMTDDQASEVLSWLQAARGNGATAGQKRAAMFCGSKE